MKRILIGFLLWSLFAVPVFAGQYEDALRTGEPVLLYLHTKYCGYCKQFNPIFEKLFVNYKNKCKFVKIDAESPYGYLLMQDLRASYVPFAVMSDARRHYFIVVEPNCLLEYECIEKEIKNFIK